MGATGFPFIRARIRGRAWNDIRGRYAFHLEEKSVVSHGQRKRFFLVRFGASALYVQPDTICIPLVGCLHALPDVQGLQQVHRSARPSREISTRIVPISVKWSRPLSKEETMERLARPLLVILGTLLPLTGAWTQSGTAQQGTPRTEVERLRDYQARQRLGVRLLDGISKSLPELLWLDRLSVSRDQITIDGRAYNTNAIANFIEALDKLPDFAEPTLRSATQRARRDLQIHPIPEGRPQARRRGHAPEGGTGYLAARARLSERNAGDPPAASRSAREAGNHAGDARDPADDWTGPTKSRWFPWRSG